MPQKTYRIYHADGKPENIEGASVICKKTKDGLKIKIGKRTITGARMLTEVLEAIELPTPPKQVNDIEDE